MADIPLSLAIISTAAPVIAGALPLAVGWIRDSAREKRADAELHRQEEAEVTRKKRELCIRLLRLTRDFRVLVENDSRGPELAENAERLRQSAADIAGQADEVEFMVPAAETEALSLASAAGRLADPFVRRQNRDRPSLSDSPELADFDKCLAAFKRAARDALNGQQTVSAE